jgi:hypothetical protein
MYLNSIKDVSKNARPQFNRERLHEKIAMTQLEEKTRNIHNYVQKSTQTIPFLFSTLDH